MLSINEIEKYYPASQKVFKKNILREYLQYKILQIIFSRETAKDLSFMGGTSLRIVYGTLRFSEDLDFDNSGLKIDEFESLTQFVKKELELEGYSVEIRNIFKGAYRCYVKIPKILFDNKLSGFEEEKILIQLDTEAQGFKYKSETFLLNKFDIFSRIFVTPKDILLSQKLWAILNRKVLKGRDFYDSSFLFGITKPNYQYLKFKAGISNNTELKKRLLEKLANENVEKLVKDVEPFLMKKDDVQRILRFKDFIDTLK
jgi:predicted nucleotidyltransferase component of viral defense system